MFEKIKKEGNLIKKIVENNVKFENIKISSDLLNNKIIHPNSKQYTSEGYLNINIFTKSIFRKRQSKTYGIYRKFTRPQRALYIKSPYEVKNINVDPLVLISKYIHFGF
jgi:hypothetical protein